MKRHTCCFFLGVILLTASGCGGTGLLQATGRLTHKGRPVPSTYVFFNPAEAGKRSSSGLTDDDGNFTLRFSRTEPGVLPGTHTIHLQYYVSAQEELGEVKPKAPSDLKKVIAKYNDPEKSPLKFEITKNGQFVDIQLPE